MAGARRFVFNWALESRIDHYKIYGETLKLAELSQRLTQLKNQPETTWLKECDSQLLQQALADCDRAYKNFFAKRARFPGFKSRKDSYQSFRIPQRVKIETGQCYVPKVGWLRLRQSQAVEGTTKSATFKLDPCGHWHVTIVTEFELPDVSLPLVNPEKVVGLDLGLKDLVVTSEGERVAPPRHFRHQESKLAHAQRSLSRKGRGSNNRAKAKIKVARLHQKVSNQRRDHLHKLTTRLVGTHDGICIEDLCVKGLARTKLAKSVLDAGWGELRRQLDYKCLWNYKQLSVIDRWFPSSKLCRFCGTIHDHLKLSDREWVCECGAVHDRDFSAAHNIRLQGLRTMDAVGHTESVNACGEDVRPALAAG
uniref:Putative transposase n=1 Tax=viral metagenome TaxID=1070528 RepID=A0A6H1ZHS3_9ZZZZ